MVHFAPVPALPEPVRKNAIHLYLDVFWFGVLYGSAISYLTVYAARLGASSLQVGLLTAGPAAVNLLISLPAGHRLERRPLIRATFRSAAWHRAAYLALIPLPGLFGASAQVWAMVLLTLAMSLPGTVLAVAFNAMFADVVPPEWRALVVGRRNALLSGSLIGTSLLCGWLLNRIMFPLNYQVVFGLGVLGASMSTYHLGRIHSPGAEVEPLRIGRPLDDAARPGQLRFVDALRSAPGLRFLTRSRGGRLLRLDVLRGSFGPFLASYLGFYVVMYIPVPLFPLYWVRELNLTDGAISLGSASFFTVMLLVSLGLRRLSAGLRVAGAVLLWAWG